MAHNNINNPSDALNREMNDFFAKARIPHSRSKEEVWNALQTQLDERPKKQPRVIPLRTLQLVAASIAILLGAFLFMNLYTKQVVVPHGQHQALVLPDGSTLELNAGSKVEYHPYWWRFSREVKFFRGEAFFEVKKGKSFKVHSEQGSTEVLGTSFNIYARNNAYRVACITGKVRVSSISTQEQVILSPNTQARLTPDVKIQVDSLQHPNQVTAWRSKSFIFTAAPISEIFEELERQYNITITFNTPDTTMHTVNFTANMNKELVLNMICKPNGLRFSSGDGKNYTISAIQ